MRVLVYPADLGGCGYYRLLFAAMHLQSLGHDIVIEWPGKETGFEVYLEDEKPIDFKLPCDNVDVIVMQRISHVWHTSVVPLMQSKGIAVVVDMDDDLSNIHRDNAAYWNYHPRNIKTPFSWKHTEQVCRAAAMVTVSTKSLLKKYAGHGRGAVIDNFIPEHYLDIVPIREHKPVFGWAGTIQSHPADLQVCGPAIRTLVNQGHKFKVIGPGHKVKEYLRLEQEPESTGVVQLANWASALTQLDVGMVPLEPSAFNTSKSRLKGLEYNSLGIPYVASSREEYRKFHRESGGGFLVDTPKTWIKAIGDLMTNETLRKELGERGRAFAETQTIEQNSWRWWEAWTQAHENLKAGKV